MNECGGRTVLIVDDNLDVLELLRQLLLIIGIPADTAVSGQDALAKMRDCKFSLVLLDMFMPGGNGMEVLKTMKYGMDSTPVIAMSAFHENRQRALDAGAVAFIPKPFDIDLLLEAVKKYGARELV